MIFTFWHEYLFRPVFNILIYFYNEYTAQNLGVAVIYLTILLRLVLLPFSVVSVWKQAFYKKLSKEIGKIAEAYKNDPVMQNQETREFLKRHRVNPWSKAIVLGVQALTLILLYQVFLGGIRGEKMDQLYSWVRHPDFVNTIFFGFDLGAKNFLWAAAVGVFLFVEISLEQRGKKQILMNSEIVYKYFFPIFCSVLLYILPMVKSLFILTSLIFSAIVVNGIQLLFNLMEGDEKGAKKLEEEDDEE
ncbi:MAG: YidC/Oxa1 family membrane protein insertase [Patescibacteria group bacterium]